MKSSLFLVLALAATAGATAAETGLAPGLPADPSANLRYYFPPDEVVLRVERTQVCIYGGTSAGVVAALELRRLGIDSIVVHPGIRLGGLSAGGLGETDIGNKSAIQGLSREFYVRIGAKATPPVAEDWKFEPSRARAVFAEMIGEAGAPVFYRSFLESVEMQGGRIVSARMENGLIVHADYFIDATYEGDLMALAGVTFTTGRESNATHGETLNGSQVGSGHQFLRDVSPYVVAGDASSGLLPGIETTTPVTGQGDQRIQAYNFRMTLTDNAANRKPFEQPIGYDRSGYVLLERYLAAGFGTTFDNFFHKFDRVTADKTDTNNHGAFSTDFIGQNFGWPTGSYAAREAIYQAHVTYQKGLMWFAANDPTVPAAIRTKMNTFGLTLDEFVETGGWPGQLYVREARRMVGDHVIAQPDVAGTRLVSDSVGLAAYGMDSHNTRRFVNASGYVRNEGNVQAGVSTPYPLSYRAIVPRRGECGNLAVPVCVSASHIAYGSVRMEPVFMLLAQAAANAIAQALPDGGTLQDVNVAALQAVLEHRGQRLYWVNRPVPAAEGAIVIDTEDGAPLAAVSGGWSTSTSSPGYLGAGYLHDGNTGLVSGQNAKSVIFNLNPATAGSYNVWLRWTANPNRATNAPVMVAHAGGTTQFSINQTTNGGQWVRLGTGPFSFAAGAGSVTLSNAGANGYIIADAVRYTPSAAALPTVRIDAVRGLMREGSGEQATLLVTRDSPTSGALLVQLAYSGSAQAGIDYAPPPSNVTLADGLKSTTFDITAMEDLLPEGTELVRVTLSTTDPNYQVGGAGEAVVTIADRPYDDWRQAHGATAANEMVADGDDDADGIPNGVEFVIDTDPRAFNAMPSALAADRDGTLGFELLAPAPWPPGGSFSLWESGDLSAASWRRVALAPEVVDVGPGWQLLRWSVPAGSRRATFLRGVADIP